MKYALFLFSISLVFNACKEDCDDDGKCTSEELAWNPYYDGQMLVFENDSLPNDTAIVHVKVTDEELNNLGENCTKYQSIQSYFKIGNDSLIIHVRHRISYPKYDNRPCLYSPSSQAYFEDYSDSISMSINNVNYSNVRLLMGLFNQYTITNIYYSKSKGVLSYQLGDSTIWRIIN